MKKLFLLLFIVLCSIYSFAQFPVSVSQGSPTTLNYARGGIGADSALVLKTSFTDTTRLNLGFLKFIPGAAVRVGDLVYIRNNAATAWLPIGARFALEDNLFEANRRTNMANYRLALDSGKVILHPSTNNTTDTAFGVIWNNIPLLSVSTIASDFPNTYQTTIQSIKSSNFRTLPAVSGSLFTGGLIQIKDGVNVSTYQQPLVLIHNTPSVARIGLSMNNDTVSTFVYPFMDSVNYEIIHAEFTNHSGISSKKFSVLGRGDIFTAHVGHASGAVDSVLTIENGFITYRTKAEIGGGGGGAVTSVGATAPAAGFTITGTNPITGSGTFVFTLSDDLAAVEGLSTTGIVRRTASNTWTAGGVVTFAEGGTGLTSLGTSLQSIRVNSGATALEYYTPTLQTVTNGGNTTTNEVEIGREVTINPGTLTIPTTSALWLSKATSADQAYIQSIAGGGADAPLQISGSIIQLSGSTGLVLNSGNLSASVLTNITTQNRLIGQISGTGQIGYVTLGSNISLTGGVLAGPSVPAQFNPIAGTNMTITGTYPNMTFNSSGGGGSGTDNANIGTGFNILKPSTQEIKRIGVGFGILGDSTGTANTNTFTVDTLSVSTRAWRQKGVDSLTALKEDQKSFLGLIKSQTTFSSLTGYTSVGGATWGTSAGSITVTGGTNDYGKYLTYDYYSQLEKYKFTVNAKIVSVGTGVAIGVATNNSNVYAYYNPTTGILKIERGAGTAFVSSTATLSCSANDVVQIVMERNIGIMYASVRNVTTNSAVLRVAYRFDLTNSTPNLPPSTGKFSVFSMQAGSLEVDSLAVESSESVKADLLILEASRIAGCYVGAPENSTVELLRRHMEVVNRAGSGDRTTQWLNALPELLALKPKVVLMCDPLNDTINGVPRATTRANYDSIVRSLQGIGAVVYHLDGIYQSSYNIRSWWIDWINAQYPAANIIKNWDQMSALSGVNTSDNLHLTSYGDSILYNNILSGFKWNVLKKRSFYENQFLLSPLDGTLLLRGPALPITMLKFNDETNLSPMLKINSTNIGEIDFMRADNTGLYSDIGFRDGHVRGGLSVYGAVTSPSGTQLNLGVTGGIAYITAYTFPSTGYIPLYIRGGNSIVLQNNTINTMTLTQDAKIGTAGITAPTAYLQLTGGITAGASLRLTNGTAAPTSPFEGDIWKLTDKAYFVISTGTATKEFTLNDIALTSGRVPLVTTNGRLTDNANFTFATSTLSLGVAGSAGGAMVLAGATSGTATINVAAAAGSTTFTLPVGNGTSGYYLQTNGSGVTSWQPAGSSLTVSDNSLLLTGSVLTTNKVPQALTDGATITMNANLGFNGRVVLGGNRTLSITNPENGTFYSVKFVQDGTGGRTITLPGGTSGTISTTIGDSTIVTGFYGNSGWSWSSPLTASVTSITGTANQVIASASTGAVTLSLPQDIHTSATPRFAGIGIGAAQAGPQEVVTITASTSPGVGSNGYFMHVSGTLIERSSGTHTIFAGVAIDGLLVTSGAATLTDGVSFYVANASNGTVTGNNYALWIDAGLNRFDGGIMFGVVSTSSNLSVDDNTYNVEVTSGTPTITLPSTSGRTGREITVINSGASTAVIATSSSQVIGNSGSATTLNVTAGTSVTIVAVSGGQWRVK